MFTARIFGLGSFLAASAIQASVLLSDDFSYPDGPLVRVGAEKWTTHSGTAAQIEVRNGQILLSQKQTEDVSALLQSELPGTTVVATLYARFKATFSSLPTGVNGAYFAHFKDAALTTGFRCRLFATTNSAAAGCFRLGISAAASAATAILPEDLQLQTPYTIVCRMAVTNNVSTLWLNPSSETDFGITSTDEAATKTAAAFAFRESLSSGAGMGELAIDDLVVATTFGEVIERSPSLAITISLDGPIVRLRWPAQSDLTYSVWTSATMPGEWLPVAAALWFSNGEGLFEELWDPAAVRYYRVGCP
jgi:hypothetical protein